jgi:hypothetical protein
MAAKKPKLLITVATTRLFLSSPSSLYIRAQTAITWSPVIWTPRSSTAMSRSPSPSNASPTSAPVSRTRADRSPVCCEPQSRLMLIPSGAQWMAVTSAPSSEKTAGASR